MLADMGSKVAVVLFVMAMVARNQFWDD